MALLPIKEILAELNEQQRLAVEQDGSPLLIVAGAGTGKTATLAHRVAYRIATGTDPSRILLLTFTRRASAEMLRRVEGILRRLDAGDQVQRQAGKVWGGTFHATATRLLRLHGRAIGLDPTFTILDRGDSEDLMGLLRTDLGLAKNSRRFPLKGTCMDIYSRCVNARETVEQAVEAHFPWCKEESDELRRLFAAYVDHKGVQSVLDYDDLLLFWHGLLSDSRVARSVRSRFDWVLVDEYQDTNVLQAEILQMLCPGGKNLTVVGDDAQAIYSFRAATIRNILDFPVQFPDTTTVTLEQNYRSVQPILDATNEVIAGATERHEKKLWSSRLDGSRPQLVCCEDEDEQGDFVIRQVLEHREAGIPLRRQAVLFRASHHSLSLELELARRNIPFHKYGGLRFVETAHVKDLLAFLRLAENPKDLMAGTRVLMLLPGVGPKKARGLMDVLAAGAGADIADGGAAGGEEAATPAGAGEALNAYAEAEGNVPAPGIRASFSDSPRGHSSSGFAGWAGRPAPSAAAAPAWEGMVALMTEIGSREPGDLASQIKRIRLFYAPLLERLYDNARARILDLEQLEGLATRYPDRARFLAEIALDPPSYTEDLAGPPLLDEDFLILSTMHSAKGLEWDAVYVIHAADGNIPSDMATGRLEEIEEERRLFYVALTRAKDWLYVCYPLRYYSYPRTFSDVHGYAQLTRFLPASVRRLFEEIQAGGDAALLEAGHSDAQAGSGPEQGITTEDIRERLKGWF
jgi:DNA helicase-2/ATP-dependent DNA helicase PcrA